MKNEIKPSNLETQITRRAFVVGSLAAGFALAVTPVSAETITTDSNGLIAGEVKVPVQGGEIPAYRAMPASGGPFPTVLVVQEIFGVHEHIKDICRRLAKLGYFAVAPALYAREGDVSKLSDIQEIMKVVAKVPDDQVAADLDATVAWAKSTGKADTTKLGITGFCCGVAWYGPLQIPTSELRPHNAIDLAKEIDVPVLGLYGGADAGISVAQIEQMRAALKAAGKPSEIVVYPDTPHGFNADYRPSYRPEAAKDSWKRMRDWFAAHGVA
jgi:carboxymethylenebutenolidase